MGLALWEDPDLPARAFSTLQVTPRTIVAQIAEVANAHQVQGLVVGLPLRLDGREGHASRRARKIAVELERATGLSVALQDERLTTMQAQTERVAAGVKGRAGIDARAAAIVLQTYVDGERVRRRGDHGE